VGETFRGGVPYAIDVNRLIETFSISLEEGRIITHTELEGATDCKRGTRRYYSVVNAWIRAMFSSYRTYIIWRQREGVVVLDPAKVLQHGEKRTKEKIRQTCKAVGIFDVVERERLSPPGQLRCDHDRRVGRMITTACIAARSEFACSLGPVEVLPKRQIEGAT